MLVEQPEQPPLDPLKFENIRSVSNEFLGARDGSKMCTMNSYTALSRRASRLEILGIVR